MLRSSILRLAQSAVKIKKLQGKSLEPWISLLTHLIRNWILQNFSDTSFYASLRTLAYRYAE